MGGGLMQLVAYGAQDIYLTGKPQITFFKAVYRRYTNFAIESIQQDVQASPLFGSQVVINIARNGDLLKRIWIEYSPFDILAGLNNTQQLLGYQGYTVAANLGHAIIDYIDIQIGGQLIDRHYGKWLTIWNYLSESNPTGEQGAIDNYATGPGEYTSNPIYGPAGSGDNAVTEVYPRATRYNRMAYTHRSQVNVISNTGSPQLAWIPLQFWFCRNPGLAIPLVSLQYHEISIIVNFAQLGLVTNMPSTRLNGNEFSRFAVYADFVYLDTKERRQFSQNAHEYLIDQLQVINNTTHKDIDLYFKQPVKEILWSSSPEIVSFGAPSPADRTQYYTVVPGLGSPSKELDDSNYSLSLNGVPRISRDLKYFTRNQIWDYHTGYGSILFPNSVAVYSFALRPEENQPSGSCNFSRIDSAKLVRSTTDPIDIYAININILRIMSGKAGLAYII